MTPADEAADASGRAAEADGRTFSAIDPARYESLIRLRMSAHEAHYGGNLVDGARLLGLFGDVATELLIALDGDEGLFLTYEAVEFLVPVFAGDYIEARGRIVRVGRTSRGMEFEALKVIQARPDINSSAADLLPEPIVVCRARGVCVVPQALQRMQPQ
jgi:3-aminobutyryl-CoA ammonia-lyase